MSQSVSMATGTSKCFPRIQDYAVVGDCRSVALISRFGAVEWLCWPRFDSPSIFAALLDRERGGHWLIVPSGRYTANREYVEDTNVLRTTFTCDSGAVVVTDLMPVASESVKESELWPDHELIREAECLWGDVELRVDFYPRFDYGTKAGRLREIGRLGVRADAPGVVLWLRSSHALEVNEHRAKGTIRLRAGERARFSLTYGEDSPVVLPLVDETLDSKVAMSIEWWQSWARKATYSGPYREAVVRSALALKLLTYAPSGAVVAAATSSLPERLRSELNWDYRYCWLRDASMTVRAMLGLGYWDEADAFLNWMLHATALTRPELRIMYDVFGENAPREYTLEQFSGYKDSRPVRMGNAARDQLQLDVYGEVADAVSLYAFHGGRFDRSTESVLRGIGDYVASHWAEPDDGIWEPRGGRTAHTHSRVLCWTALDRLIRLSERGHLKRVPIERYSKVRQNILEKVKRESWNEQLQSYTATVGRDDMDASLLLISWYGFEAADCARMRSTHARVREQLGTPNGLLYRYRVDPPEGAFGICGFWQVEFLALGGGAFEEASRLFEQQLAFRNDVGLYAEEIDPQSGDALGNFPQAFTHVGLISAALSLQEREKGSKQLAHRAPSAESSHGESHK